ncbi:MAG: gamma-glutamylcyclotransferase family protein [Draconibacterium sp.]
MKWVNLKLNVTQREMQNLFVYGTLQLPSVVLKLTGKFFETDEAVLTGFKSYCVRNCDYPAIIPNREAKVSGLLLKNVDDISLQAIDYFEGNEYTKQKVTVIVAGKDISAFTYVWNLGKELLEDKDWDINFFKKNFLHLYTE